MPTLTNYKGLEVVDDATGDGGVALTDNFMALADRAPYQTNADPTSSDDNTEGFEPGDEWLNTSTQVMWACINASTGAAVWKSIYLRTSTGLELIPNESSESVSVLGSLVVGNILGWQSKSSMQSATDGNISLTNHAGSGFGLLQFGGTSSSYPALKVSGTTLQCRLADNSADAAFQSSALTITGNSGSGGPISTWTGSIYAGATPHMLIQPSGTTAVSTWNSAGTILGVNDPTGYSGFLLDMRGNGSSTSYFSVTSSGFCQTNSGFQCRNTAGYEFASRSRMSSPSDGAILFTNNAITANATVEMSASIVSGLTGATARVRFVGATASGAPTSGTFVVGDIVFAQNGHIWQCTTAGSPGTWSMIV